MSLPGRAHCSVDRARGGDKQKIVNQLAVRHTACARTPAGQGWRSLNESRDNTFAPAADSRFCTASFSSRQS